MADKFECDSCKEVFDLDEKRGYIELVAKGWDTLPHANFKGRLDLCHKCFAQYQAKFVNVNPQLKPFRG